MNNNFFEEARRRSVTWAGNLLKLDPKDWLILDTETTGLDDKAEVIQIGVTDGAGNALMDNLLCKPCGKIPVAAIAVHHITNEMVADAPLFVDHYERLTKIVEGKTLVIYNAQYDMRILAQSAAHFPSLANHPINPLRVDCAMLAYSEYVGEWNDYRGDFKWQKLQGGDHSALGDCRATLEVIKKMAKG